MNLRRLAIALACILEIPLLAVFLSLPRWSKPLDRGFGLLLVWYHIVPSMILAFVYLKWNLGQSLASTVIFVMAMFLIQVAVTTPLVFLVLRLVGARRRALRGGS